MKGFIYRYWDWLYVLLIAPVICVLFSWALTALAGQFLIQLFQVTADNFYPQILYMIGIVSFLNAAVMVGGYFLICRFLAYKEGQNVH